MTGAWWRTPFLRISDAEIEETDADRVTLELHSDVAMARYRSLARQLTLRSGAHLAQSMVVKPMWKPSTNVLTSIAEKFPNSSETTRKSSDLPGCSPWNERSWTTNPPGTPSGSFSFPVNVNSYWLARIAFTQGFCNNIGIITSDFVIVWICYRFVAKQITKPLLSCLT